MALLVGAAASGPSPIVAPTPPEFSLTLYWTAPGDDGQLGRAQMYDLRYSTTMINEANFQSATVVHDLPFPGPAGSPQSAAVGGLDGNTVYYFALRTRDDAGNWSRISNVVVFPLHSVGVGDPSFPTTCTPPWPNPARSSTRCGLTLGRGAMVEVDVFGVDGRHVRSLAKGWRPAGRTDLDWDLRDGSGEPVASGVYLMRARLGGTTWSRRVTVIR